MSTRKPRFTTVDHEEMGKLLYNVRGELMGALEALTKGYPKSDVDTQRVLKALHYVDLARMGMDSKMASEHPSEFSARTYYPGPAGFPE